MCTLVQLARGGDSDAERLVDQYDWYIMPVVNPDGYSFTFTDVSIAHELMNHYHLRRALPSCAEIWQAGAIFIHGLLQLSSKSMSFYSMCHTYSVIKAENV